MGLFDKLFGPPTQDKFARQVRDGLKRAGDPRQAEYDVSEFRLVFLNADGEPAGTENLTNLYLEHCNVERADRRQHLQHVVRDLLASHKDMPDEYADAGHDLLPVVRSPCNLEFIRLQQEIAVGQAPDIP